jgi:hypothetical protein
LEVNIAELGDQIAKLTNDEAHALASFLVWNYQDASISLSWALTWQEGEMQRALQPPCDSKPGGGTITIRGDDPEVVTHFLAYMRKSCHSA